MDPQEYQQYIEASREVAESGSQIFNDINEADTRYEPEFDIDISETAENPSIWNDNQIDELAERFSEMTYEISKPFDVSMRTGMMYPKEYIQKILDIGLPAIRCRCNRVINYNIWQRVFQEMYNNYDYYSSHPGEFEKVLSQLNIPNRECCRISYLTAQVHNDQLPILPGLITERKIPTMIRLTELGHSIPEIEKMNKFKRDL